MREVRGVMRALPGPGVLWVAGFLAITGTPPFGLFFSELTILKAAFDQHHREWIGVIYLVLLAVIFIGMATAFLRTAQGQPPAAANAAATAPPLAGRGAAARARPGWCSWLGLHMPSGSAARFA